MKYNNREEYQGGNFYLLDLVEADHRTLEEFVDKIESEEQMHNVEGTTDINRTRDEPLQNKNEEEEYNV